MLCIKTYASLLLASSSEFFGSQWTVVQGEVLSLLVVFTWRQDDPPTNMILVLSYDDLPTWINPADSPTRIICLLQSYSRYVNRPLIKDIKMYVYITAIFNITCTAIIFWCAPFHIPCNQARVLKISTPDLFTVELNFGRWRFIYLQPYVNPRLTNRWFWNLTPWKKRLILPKVTERNWSKARK